ncbi:MAG: FkbM family methyltransferase [Parvularcula sp.]
MFPVLDLCKTLFLYLDRRPDPLWVIDGGCHYGKFTRAAHETLKNIHVLGFEPDPDSYGMASGALSDLPRTELLPAALSSRKGNAAFFRGTASATHSLLPRPEGEKRPYYPDHASLPDKTMVATTTLDEECRLRKIDHIGLLKLDLQGGELEALKGTKQLLLNHAIDIISAEVVFIQKYAGQPLFHEIWAYLNHHQYSFYALSDVKVGLYHQEPQGARHNQWNQADALFISPAMRQAIDGASGTPT